MENTDTLLLKKLKEMITNSNEEKAELDVILGGEKITISVDSNNTVEIGDNISYNIKNHQYEDKYDNNDDDDEYETESRSEKSDDENENDRILDFDDNISDPHEFNEYIVSEFGTEDLYVKYFDLYNKHIVKNRIPDNFMKFQNEKFIEQLLQMIKDFGFDEDQFEQIMDNRKNMGLIMLFTKYLADNSDNLENVEILCSLIECDFSFYLDYDDVSKLGPVLENSDGDVYFIEDCIINIVKDHKWEYYKSYIMQLLRMKRLETSNIIDEYGDETLKELLYEIIEEIDSE